MLTKTEIERLAGMANALRPDWPVNSLTTAVAALRTRAYRDVAVALAWIATDANTKTPGRIAEPGPWWKATQADSPTPTIHVRPQCPDHPSQDAGTCAPCARLAAATDHTAGIAACRQAIRTKGTKP